MRNFLKVLTVSIMLVPALFSQEKQTQGKASPDKPEAAANVRFSADLLDGIAPCDRPVMDACWDCNERPRR